MTEEIQKRRDEKKKSEEIFKAVEKSREHFLEATKEVTKAEKHLEYEAQKQIDIDESLQQTEKDIVGAEEEIIETHEKIKESRDDEAEKKYRQEKKKSPLLNKPP